MTTPSEKFLARWHPALEGRDLEAVSACLHPDVVFRSPAVHKPYAGREVTTMLLSNVIEVFEDFTYTDTLDMGDRLGLVFSAKVGDRQLQGWDYITLDEDGLATEFTVMLRPLSGLTAVAQAMQARLEAST